MALFNPDVETEVLDETATRIEEPWKLIVFNDDIHTFEEVIHQLMKAVRADRKQAETWAWEIHSTGKACVCTGDFEDCFRANLILLEIQLITQLEG